MVTEIRGDIWSRLPVIRYAWGSLLHVPQPKGHDEVTEACSAMVRAFVVLILLFF